MSERPSSTAGVMASTEAGVRAVAEAVRRIFLVRAISPTQSPFLQYRDLFVPAVNVLGDLDEAVQDDVRGLIRVAFPNEVVASDQAPDFGQSVQPGQFLVVQPFQRRRPRWRPYPCPAFLPLP